MALSKSSIQKLRAVKAAILAQPQFYEQNKWVSSIDSCGTICCIAGWSDFVVNGAKVHNARAVELEAEPGMEWNVADEWIEIASKALGITWDQAQTLTDGSDVWANGLDLEYARAKTAEERAVVAAKWIEYFIGTGGEESGEE